MALWWRDTNFVSGCRWAVSYFADICANIPGLENPPEEEHQSVTPVQVL